MCTGHIRDTYAAKSINLIRKKKFEKINRKLANKKKTFIKKYQHLLEESCR